MQLAERFGLQVHTKPFYSQNGQHVNGYYLYSDKPVKGAYDHIMVNGELKPVVFKIKPRFNKDKLWSVYQVGKGISFLKSNQFKTL